jgi:hypothetical protein
VLYRFVFSYRRAVLAILSLGSALQLQVSVNSIYLLNSFVDDGGFPVDLFLGYLHHSQLLMVAGLRVVRVRWDAVSFVKFGPSQPSHERFNLVLFFMFSLHNLFS